MGWYVLVVEALCGCCFGWCGVVSGGGTKVYGGPSAWAWVAMCCVYGIRPCGCCFGVVRPPVLVWVVLCVCGVRPFGCCSGVVCMFGVVCCVYMYICMCILCNIINSRSIDALYGYRLSRLPSNALTSYMLAYNFRRASIDTLHNRDNYPAGKLRTRVRCH